MHAHPSAPLSLFVADGRRKYLTPDERGRFIETARRCDRRELGTLCLMLAFAGCRISEALALSGSSIDCAEGVVVIRSLKKRGALMYRQVPLPSALIEEIVEVHARSECGPEYRLWTLSRSRAWQLVKQVMAKASIASGPHCVPKGLRHGFGIHALRSGVPINLVQRWLGHASLETTMIYLDALGQEEREMAQRMWK